MRRQEEIQGQFHKKAQSSAWAKSVRAGEEVRKKTNRKNRIKEAQQEKKQRNKNQMISNNVRGEKHMLKDRGGLVVELKDEDCIRKEPPRNQLSTFEETKYLNGVAPCEERKMNLNGVRGLLRKRGKR